MYAMQYHDEENGGIFMDRERRELLTMAGVAVAGALYMPLQAGAEERVMDIWTALKTRRSIRSYTAQDVTEEEVRAMLEAAMLAPSAGNEQPWEFVLVREKATLEKVGDINKFAAYAPRAALGVMVCLNRDKEKYAGMGILDVAACTQNLLLAARGLGLGAVWTGVYPVEERIRGFRELLGLPESVIPVAFVLIGRPRGAAGGAAERFNASCIHRERWGKTAE